MRFTILLLLMAGCATTPRPAIPATKAKAIIQPQTVPVYWESGAPPKPALKLNPATQQLEPAYYTALAISPNLCDWSLVYSNAYTVSVTNTIAVPVFYDPMFLRAYNWIR